MSVRSDVEVQEARAWIAAEEKRQRDEEDRLEYQRYIAVLREEQRRVPTALRVEPLSFEQWQTLMPDDVSNPALRASMATSRSLWNSVAQLTKEQVANGYLEDHDLQQVGFSLSNRVTYPDIEVTPIAVMAAFDQFESSNDPRYSRDLHYDQIASFLQRNGLYPTGDSVARAFQLLLAMAVIKPTPAAVVPQYSAPLNQYGVNLSVEAPKVSDETVRREYFEKIVVIDPRTGVKYTQYQLDRLPSDEFKRLMFGDFYEPRIRDVIDSSPFRSKQESM